MESQNEDNISSNDEYGSENLSERSYGSENENDQTSSRAVGRQTFMTAMRPEELNPKLKAFLEKI